MLRSFDQGLRYRVVVATVARLLVQPPPDALTPRRMCGRLSDVRVIRHSHHSTQTAPVSRARNPNTSAYLHQMREGIKGNHITLEYTCSGVASFRPCLVLLLNMQRNIISHIRTHTHTHIGWGVSSLHSTHVLAQLRTPYVLVDHFRRRLPRAVPGLALDPDQ